MLRRRQLLPMLQTAMRDCELIVRQTASSCLGSVGPQVRGPSRRCINVHMHKRDAGFGWCGVGAALGTTRRSVAAGDVTPLLLLTRGRLVAPLSSRMPALCRPHV